MVNNTRTLTLNPFTNKHWDVSKQSEWELVEEGYLSANGRISDYDPDRTYWEHSCKRCPGTTSWLLELEIVQTWLNWGNISCIWLTGKIGRGKTITTSGLLSQLIEQPGQSPESVFHFFYSHSYKSRLRAVDLFQSYVKQMLNYLDKYKTPYPPEITVCLKKFFGSKSSFPTFNEITA